MSDINSVTLIGRLTEKPLLRYTSMGTPVSTLKVANNTYVKRPDGGVETKANFFNVTVWGKTAENCSKYLDKGRQVGILGRLEHRVWQTQTGEKRSTIDIVAQRVQFIGSPISSDQQSTEPTEIGAGATEKISYEPTQESETRDEPEVIEDFNEPLADEEVPF